MVQRVGADLSLDPLLPQRTDLVARAAVDLDHIRLPAVDVTLVRDRRLHDVAEPFGVAGGDARPRGQELVEARELWNPDRAEDVREPVVEPRFGDLEVGPRLDSVMAHAADRDRELGVVGRDGAALAGGDDLARVEGEAAQRAEAPARAPTAARAERAGGVFEHGQPF